jgi:hypothetical protein
MPSLTCRNETMAVCEESERRGLALFGQLHVPDAKRFPNFFLATFAASPFTWQHAFSDLAGMPTVFSSTGRP